jgi:hypothetical protein
MCCIAGVTPVEEIAFPVKMDAICFEHRTFREVPPLRTSHEEINFRLQKEQA